jgi:sirohydrochlorin ferrochelatase
MHHTTHVLSLFSGNETLACLAASHMTTLPAKQPADFLREEFCRIIAGLMLTFYVTSAAALAEHRHLFPWTSGSRVNMSFAHYKKTRPFLKTTWAKSSFFASPSLDEGTDLFDYFDPLLSPHAYPDGISPGNRPKQHQRTSSEKSLSKKMGFTLPIKLDNETPTQAKSTSENAKKDQADLFDYFDPLLSPHSYPKGISSDHKPEEWKGSQQRNVTGIVDSTIKRVGILLMDHGSQKIASNARLHALADLYQSSMDERYDENEHGQRRVIVKAVHMEIASPSIPDGLRVLRDAGVHEIICHPFFLSPDGRHVKDDIPEIINTAIESLNIQIPVITTEPVGSNISLMLSAVHNLVVQNSKILED